MFEDDLGVAVDGIDAEAKVSGYFFPVPAFAEQIEDRAMARVKQGDFLRFLIGKGGEMQPWDFTEEDMDDAGFAFGEMSLAEFPIEADRTGTAACHRADRAHDRANVGPLPERECVGVFH